MVGVSASVNLPLHHKVQKFSSGTGSPGWSRKKGRKTVVVMVVEQDVDGSSLLADSRLELVDLVRGLAATWCSVSIHQMNRVNVCNGLP